MRESGARADPHGGILALLVLGLCLPLAEAFLSPYNKIAKYTTNSMCVETNCVNPIFPAMHKLGRSVLDANQNLTWSCVDDHRAWRTAGFCKRVVSSYPFAVPDPQDPTVPQEDVIRQQEKEAVTAYVAHVTGIGEEFWKLTDPWEHNDCIQSIWRMACYTYFPRCNRLSPAQYLRPCESSCRNYIKQCGVSCCDEAVQCVFTHHREMPDGYTETEEGYIGHAGPSPLCTGIAAPMAQPATLLAALFTAIVLWQPCSLR